MRTRVNPVNPANPVKKREAMLRAARRGLSGQHGPDKDAVALPFSRLAKIFSEAHSTLELPNFRTLELLPQ